MNSYILLKPLSNYRAIDKSSDNLKIIIIKCLNLI